VSLLLLLAGEGVLRARRRADDQDLVGDETIISVIGLICVLLLNLVL
jgi:hypothetical protein